MRHTDTHLQHGHRRQSSAASEIEYAQSMQRRKKIVRPPRRRQIRVLLVWRDVGCGGEGSLPVHRHSYRGHRVELWSISDWPQNQKQLKVKQSRQTRMCLRFILLKQVQYALDQWQGSWVRFSLDFSAYLFLAPNGPGEPVFSRCPFICKSTCRSFSTLFSAQTFALIFYVRGLIAACCCIQI